MTRVVSILGLFVGCAILAIAMAGNSRSDDAEPRGNETLARAQNCHVEEVMLDEGYGVSRKELRQVCNATD